MYRSKEETSRSGILWTHDEDNELKNIISDRTTNLSISDIALKFKRTKGGILCRIMGYAYEEKDILTLEELSKKYFIETNELKRFFLKKDTKAKKKINISKKRKLNNYLKHEKITSPNSKPETEEKQSDSTNNDPSKTGLTPQLNSLKFPEYIPLDLSLSENNEHYIYCLIEREFIKTGETIYKVGKSNHIFKRMTSYPKGSRVLSIFRVNNCHQVEKDLLTALDTNPKIQRAPNIGREYYNCNLSDLLEVFTDICLKNIA